LAPPTLSVVLPAYNEGPHLRATINALVEAVERSGLGVELVFVDDGSTDGSADIVSHAVGNRLPLRVVAQPNSGRFAARRAGLDAATADWVLLLDGRVRLEPDALKYVWGRVQAGERIWNGHVHVETESNPYGAFWNVLAELAWREYFGQPRKTSFDARSFDHYPKGTGCFLAPRATLLDAVAAFRSYYASARFVSDDTALIRWLAERESIHLSPSFACHYAPRTNLTAFVRQAVYRGSTFVDGHGRPASRFFPAAVAFFPISAGLALLALRRPFAAPALVAATALATGAVTSAAGRTRFETISCALLAPIYAVAHGLGMWRGLAMIVDRRLRSAVVAFSEGEVGAARSP
jgi:glycosyltransferase involved in cell wall biosynthesis